MGDCAWGGSEELWSAAALEAAANRHDVVACIGRWPDPRPEVSRIRAGGVRVVELQPGGPRRRRWKQRLVIRHPRQARRWGRWLSCFRGALEPRPDVACFSLGDTHAMVRCYEYQFLAEMLDEWEIPYFVICHLNPPGAVSDRWRSTTRDLFRRADRVGFVSIRQMQEVAAELETELPNALVLRNPVNMTAGDPVPWPETDRIRMASVARLDVAHKGQDRLLRALADMDQDGPAWQLELYGTGPDEAAIRRQIRDQQMEQRVLLRGHVRDIRAVWAHNQMLVMPSLMEGTPLSMVEAMLCGRPCLVTDVGGVTEWIRDGKDGFVAPSPDPQHLEATLRRAWSRFSDWNRMGEAACERALALADPDPGRTLVQMLTQSAERHPNVD